MAIVAGMGIQTQSGIKEALDSIKNYVKRGDLIVGSAKINSALKVVCYPAEKAGDVWPGYQGKYSKQKTMTLPAGKSIYIVTATKESTRRRPNPWSKDNPLYAYIYVEMKDGNRWAAVTADNYSALMDASTFKVSNINDLLTQRQDKIDDKKKQEQMDDYAKRDSFLRPSVEEFVKNAKPICKILEMQTEDYRFITDINNGWRISVPSFRSNLPGVTLYFDSSFKLSEPHIPHFSMSSSKITSIEDVKEWQGLIEEMAKILPLATKLGKDFQEANKKYYESKGMDTTNW